MGEGEVGEEERGRYKVLYGEAPLRGPTPFTFVNLSYTFI